MVVACRGDGVEAGRVAEVDLSPEAAGPPEGGKVLGRGSAPMGAVLATGPDDAEQAAGVELAQVYRCFVPVQETQYEQKLLNILKDQGTSYIVWQELFDNGAVRAAVARVRATGAHDLSCDGRLGLAVRQANLHGGHSHAARGRRRERAAPARVDAARRVAAHAAAVPDAEKCGAGRELARRGSCRRRRAVCSITFRQTCRRHCRRRAARPSEKR